MIVNLIVIAFFSLNLIRSYKTTVIVIVVWSLVLSMMSMPTVMPFNLFQILSVISILIFPFKMKKSEIKANKYPLWLCAAVSGISLFLTNYFAPISAWPMTIAIFLSLFCFPFILWYSLSSPRMVSFFLKSLIVFLLLLTIYGFIEVSIGSNPIIEWMQNSDIFTKVGNSDRARFGIKRIQSFLTYNGAMGMCCGMNFVLLLYIRMYYKDYIVQYKQILPFLLFALAACIVFTGARSVMLAFAVGLLAFARPSIFKYKWTYFLIFIFILALPVLISFLAPIITSFVDTEAVGGSNVDMRTMQLDTAVYFWHKSFWTGNGIGFTNYVIENYREDIYGAESLWFSKMMNQGLLGMVAFSITIVQPIYVLIKNKLTPCIFIVLSFLVAKTMTSAPGITEAYHLIFVVVLLKVAQTYNDRKKVKNDKIQHNSTSI